MFGSVSKSAQHGAHLRIGIGRGERRAELRVHLGGDRIFLVQAIEPDAGDATLGLTSDQDRLSVDSP
jgi:hypothetical protein